MRWSEVYSEKLGEFLRIEDEFQVHPLAYEDCLHRNQRAKLEDFGNHQFLVWFTYTSGKLYELQFLIFPDQLIFVPHEPPPGTAKSWQEYFRLSDAPADVWHLLYQALDRSTDATIAELQKLFSEVEEFEQHIFDSELDPRQVLAVKKTLSQVDFCTGHLSSVALQLRAFCQPKDDLNWKFRDLIDHAERTNRQVSLYRAQIASSIDLYWGMQANKSNRHIKKLSLLASIGLPLTFWTSFWGMNFSQLPFQDDRAFATALGVMIVSMVAIVFFLKRKGYWEN
jgi:magnesium transporter